MNATRTQDGLRRSRRACTRTSGPPPLQTQALAQLAAQVRQGGFCDCLTPRFYLVPREPGASLGAGRTLAQPAKTGGPSGAH